MVVTSLVIEFFFCHHYYKGKGHFIHTKNPQLIHTL